MEVQALQKQGGFNVEKFTSFKYIIASLRHEEINF